MTAGKRMMWYDKRHPNVVYVDQNKDLRPDINCVWQFLPFKEGLFEMVVFDPPHLFKSWGRPCAISDEEFWAKFGSLDLNDWKAPIHFAFKEGFRVLREGGFLIFKWGDHDKPLRKLIGLAEKAPLFGQRTIMGKASSTYWVCFQKEAN